MVPEVIKEKMEEVKDKDVTPPKSASIKQEMTEEDLEDWLDSMISWPSPIKDTELIKKQKRRGIQRNLNIKI